MTKYIDHKEFFARVEQEFPRADNIIKCGPSSTHITVYDKSNEHTPLSMPASEFLRAGEALGFSWKG